MAHVIELTLTVRGGFLPGVGRTSWLVHLAAANVKFIRPAGQGSALLRGEDGALQAVDFGVDHAAASRLIEAAEAMGFPEHVPRVDGEPDTSDVFTTVRLDIALDDRRNSLAVMLMAGPMRGPDLPLVRALLTELEALSPALAGLTGLAG